MVVLWEHQFRFSFLIGVDLGGPSLTSEVYFSVASLLDWPEEATDQSLIWPNGPIDTLRQKTLWHSDVAFPALDLDFIPQNFPGSFQFFSILLFMKKIYLSSIFFVFFIPERKPSYLTPRPGLIADLPL